MASPIRRPSPPAARTIVSSQLARYRVALAFGAALIEACGASSAPPGEGASGPRVDGGTPRPPSRVDGGTLVSIDGGGSADATLPPGQYDAGSTPSTGLPTSRLIGGATLDASSFFPPLGQSCSALLDAGGTVPTAPPQAFADECAGCHGPTGSGKATYPNILGPRSFDAFQSLVRTGEKDGGVEMPFFKPSWLNDDDLRRIYAYITQAPVLETYQCQPLPTMSVADIADASVQGLAAWRLPDGKTDPNGILSNVACANCHAPDPLDLAYFGFQDGDILRRGLGHLPASAVANIVDMVHAQRQEYGIGRRDPLVVRPFQPGGGMLPGGSIVERDTAFGDELVAMGLLVATRPIASPADADQALAEMWGIDRHSLRIPVPFNRYAEDMFHNPEGYVPDCSADIDGCDDHGTIADWIPTAPHIASNPGSYYALVDSYLANPTDATEASLQYQAARGKMPGTYGYGTYSLDDKKYPSLVLTNYCIRLELSGGPGCYDKGVAPFPNMADMWDIGSTANLFGTGYARWASCDTTWQSCDAAPANLPQWPAHMLLDITPGAKLSTNFSRLRHPWMTLWWTHFDPTLLVTGDPTAQKDEYFTRSLFWANDNDWVFDNSPATSRNPTYGVFAAYEVLMHNVATLQNPKMASCKLWPATDFACTAVDVRSGYYPDVINFAEQNQPANPETSNNVHYQTLFMPEEPGRRATYQLVVANMYRLFFWKLIGSLQQQNWMCNQALQELRITRAKEFLAAAESQTANSAADTAMFATLSALMAKSTASCPAL